MESGLNGLDVKQAEYLRTLLESEFNFYAKDTLAIDQELGPDSPALLRSLNKASFIEDILGVVTERVRYLRQVEEVQRRSAQLQAVGNG